MEREKSKRKSETKEPRIGVFICRFGSNIAAVIDVDDLIKYAVTLPSVVHVECINYPCSR